jgi:hypothetical protein
VEVVRYGFDSSYSNRRRAVCRARYNTHSSEYGTNFEVHLLHKKCTANPKKGGTNFEEFCTAFNVVAAIQSYGFLAQFSRSSPYSSL